MAPRCLIEHFSKLDGPPSRQKQEAWVDGRYRAARVRGGQWHGGMRCRGIRDNCTEGVEGISRRCGRGIQREATKISARKKRIRAALNDGFRDKVLMRQ